jgi:hypothetical protein
MREIRLSGSEGGEAQANGSSLPLLRVTKNGRSHFAASSPRCSLCSVAGHALNEESVPNHVDLHYDPPSHANRFACGHRTNCFAARELPKMRA